MVTTIVTNIGGQIISLTVASVFGGLVTFIMAQNKSIRLAKELESRQNRLYGTAIHALIKSQITIEWTRVMDQGYVYLHDLAAINSLNTMYQEMGGNGEIKLLMIDIKRLERRSTRTDQRSAEGFHVDPCEDDRDNI